ncbi:MAG TPA: hypothetical protein VG389_14465 [Myxococcota bacterium]|jgi:hypothetical protein|nr:hypothetical protein [Myxococcota bacterium]
MLERVALGQSRFNVPGIAADPRGVALGQLAALLFPSIDRVVAFFRAFSSDNPLGDVLAALHVFQVETPLRTREIIVLLPAQGSHFVDQGSRTARLVGGTTFTGSGKHFVLYRDDRSPLGYDSSELERAECDFALYGRDFSQTYRKVQELDFGALVKRLAPIAERPRPREPDEPPEPPPPAVWLAVRAGLAAPVRAYVWRHGLHASMAAVSRVADSAFTEARGEAALDLMLFRIQGASERVLRLFASLPGVQVFVPLGANFGVQRGFRHPFTLENCASVFAADRLHLFSGEEKRLIETAALPTFVAVEQMGPIGLDTVGVAGAPAAFPVPARAEPRRIDVQTLGSFGLTLRLLPAATSGVAVTATVVPPAQWTWLKKLVYALPSSQLAAFRVALTPEAAVMLNPQGVDSIPLGTFMEAVSPRLYLPRGWRFFPAVAPEVLFTHIGGREENLYFFLPGAAAPFFIPAEGFVTLERRALAALQAEGAELSTELTLPGPPELVNEDVGAFALWRHRLGVPPAGDGGGTTA